MGVDGFIVDKMWTGHRETARVFGFVVKDKNGDELYFAKERNVECCERDCHNNKRTFTMSLTDVADIDKEYMGLTDIMAIRYNRIRPGSQSCSDITDKVDCLDINGNNFGFIRQVEPKSCVLSCVQVLFLPTLCEECQC